MSDQFLTLKGVSILTKINVETLKKQCQAGKIIGAIKIGKTWLIPQTFIKSLIKPRVGVYIDGANMLHGGLNSGWMIDYDKLVNHLKSKFNPAIISFYDSVGYELDDKRKPKKDRTGSYIQKKSQLKFFNFLRGIGMRVVTKPLKYIGNDPAKPKNNMDSYINLDVVNEKDLWEELIVFTGDCDFDRLVDEIIGHKKRVRIYSFKKLLSYELKVKSFTNPLVSFEELDKLRIILEDTRKRKNRT